MKIYISNFKKDLTDFIEYKKSMGFKYENQIKQLAYFDQFCSVNFHDHSVITNELIDDYLSSLSGINPGTFRVKMSPVIEFSKYLVNLGKKSVIIDTKCLPTKIQYCPYIFSNQELINFFNAADSIDYSPYSPLRHETYPLLFRLLYSSGLRLNEATSLKINDIDFNAGVLKIFNSKFDKHRILPISESLNYKFAQYHKKNHKISNSNDYFFIGKTNNQICRANVDRNFHEIRWKANIAYKNKGKDINSTCGPRVHDLRHTFAVNCLKRWVHEGKDLHVYLPVLQAYLGHTCLKDTSYYLRLTIDLFPDIINKLNSNLNHLIPDIL